MAPDRPAVKSDRSPSRVRGGLLVSLLLLGGWGWFAYQTVQDRQRDEVRRKEIDAENKKWRDFGAGIQAEADRGVAEGKRTRVRFATRTGEPFRGLLAWAGGADAAPEAPPAGQAGISGSPVVQTFDLEGDTVRVSAVAGECRPALVRAGRVKLGSAPIQVVLEPAYRLRGRLVVSDGTPLSGTTFALAAACVEAEGVLRSGGHSMPPPEVAALMRDRWGQEHLGDWFAEEDETRWMVTNWTTDPEGRFDAFTPLPIRRLVLFLDGRVLELPDPAMSPPRDLDLGEVQLPRAPTALRFRLLWKDGRPVENRRVLARDAAVPMEVLAGGVTVQTDRNGWVSTESMSPGRAYRFVEDDPPPTRGRRWLGSQGIGVPVEGGEIRLAPERPSKVEWTGWMEDSPASR